MTTLGSTSTRRVFLCHASEDKSQVRQAYEQLKRAGFEPWLDEKDLLPGQNWQKEIPRALKASAAVLVFLSKTSVSKKGYVQREFRLAFDTLLEIPQGQIFVIPVKLDDCDIPDLFRDLHWANWVAETADLTQVVESLRHQGLDRPQPASQSTAPQERATPERMASPTTTPQTAGKMNTPEQTPVRPGVAVPLLVAGVSAAAGLALLATMLWNAPMLVRLGLTGYVWYALLLPLGLAAAVMVFALFNSYARYTGKALDGKIEVGGPAVVMLLIVVLGFQIVSPPLPRFDVTVFLHGEAGRQALPLRNQGSLSIDLGADRRIEPIGAKGEVRFIGIPNDMRDRSVAVALDADKYELADPNLEIKLDQEVFYAAVRAKSLRLIGTVLNPEGRPLPQAHVAMAGRSAKTDSDGRFELALPADLPEHERTLTITADGYETWRAQAVPGGNPLQARLTAAN